MKIVPQGYRVAVVGASSLLGRELLAVLEERNFPVSRLVKYEAENEESDVPIVDLRESFPAAVADKDIDEGDLDLAFLASQPQGGAEVPSFLRPALTTAAVQQPRAGAAGAHCTVIDLSETLAPAPDKVLSVPFLEASSASGKPTGLPRLSPFFISPHPAAILVSSLLLRLAARFGLHRAVAHVFEPVSEIGPRAIEELQKQTVNLLTFQKIPREVFGNQLAFNLLPRLGRSDALAGLERRLRNELREYLSNRAPVPALRLFQVPVFYSFALSLYVEMARPEAPEAVAQAIGGRPIHVRRLSQPAPSQVEATGSGDILVDSIAPDTDHPAGTWIWAVADNMRLAAVNAIEIAERELRTAVQ